MVVDGKGEIVQLVPLWNVQDVKEFFHSPIGQVNFLLVDEVDHGQDCLFGCFFDNDCAGGAFFESETGAKESFSEEDAVRRQDQLVSFHRAWLCADVVDDLECYVGWDFRVLF